MNEYRKLMESLDTIDAKGSKFDEGYGMGMFNKKPKPTRFEILYTVRDGQPSLRNPEKFDGYLAVNANSPEEAKEKAKAWLLKKGHDDVYITGVKPVYPNEDYNPMKADEVPPAPQTDPMDLVTMDVPLLIRLFELMNETVESDAELHHITTQILNVSKASDGPLTMEHYNEILNGASDEPTQE